MKIKQIILMLVMVLNLFLPQISLADTCVGQPTTGSLCNPVGGVGGDSFQTFAIHILQVFAAIAGTVTIIYVMFSGFRFLISQGNSEQVQTAKRTLQWSLSGLVVMLLSFVIISALSSFLGVKDNLPGVDNPVLTNPIKANNFDDIYGLFITGFFGIAGLIAILMIIINGFKYITARGDQEQVQAAKSGLLYAIVGIVIVLLAYVIVRATATFFGAK